MLGTAALSSLTASLFKGESVESDIYIHNKAHLFSLIITKGLSTSWHG